MSDQLPIVTWVRRVALWVSTAHRAAAIAPLLLLVVYYFFGEAAFLTAAALIPAFIFILRVAERSSDGVRDAVTGLPSPEVATDWLEANLKGRDTTKGMCVVAVSLDDLTMLEDRISAVMHETVLREVANRIGQLIRTDDLLTRGYRSDYLICLNAVAEPETENTLRFAQRLQAIMDNPFSNGPVTAYCTISIGIAQVRHILPMQSEAVVNASETALKAAKDAGPGCIRLHQKKGGMKQVNSDGDLGKQIGHALEAGQVVGWYQPQVSTNTGEITGFEALARWEHPTRGLIAPGSFIDLAARAGLSQRLSEIILTHALSSLRAWDKADLNIPSVSVNFGSDDLRNPRLVDYLRWEMDRYDISPRRLAIEVLEDVIAERHDDIIARNLRALSDIGCPIDLDDFGTGYTSILNIRRFSVSRIKIDRKLVARIDLDKDQRDLVAALLAMAERLNIETLGEGVETAAEHAMLGQLGCDHVQGFAVARPMPLGDTFNWIRSYRANIEVPANQMLPTQPEKKNG